ncbi:hypothetical protein E0Z10_g3516 [Xylaria hypoxylon]|uniref:MARVEL domain-containing protein n=1 Tax=Xylaria hypoxylon TaxID=37992 RepID=A0A4Z0YLY6_9PEZI|nr:hypothetical protein E0Z10_g3516 [Xylaria hypoxylon]
MSYVSERVAGREHIPLYPKAFVAVRILQLVLGIICLGLTGYLTAVAPIGGAVLTLFTSITTLITGIYILVAHFGPPKAYNYWAILALDIFHVLFWLIAFALLASQAALLIAYSSDYFGYYSGYTIIGSIAAAGAGLGAINWVAYIVALILHSIALHRHRKAGLHSTPGSSPSPPVVGAPAVASVEGDKFQMQPQQPQAYYPPQQVYEAPYQPQQQQQQQQQPLQQQSLPQQNY